MNAAPVDLKLPAGVVGYAIVDPQDDLLHCTFDSSQTVTERLRSDARSIVRGVGGECFKCTVTCPFNLN
jgi:hypothetical protein